MNEVNNDFKNLLICSYKDFMNVYKNLFRFKQELKTENLTIQMSPFCKNGLIYGFDLNKKMHIIYLE